MPKHPEGLRKAARTQELVSQFGSMAEQLKNLGYREAMASAPLMGWAIITRDKVKTIAPDAVIEFYHYTDIESAREILGKPRGNDVQWVSIPAGFAQIGGITIIGPSMAKALSEVRRKFPQLPASLLFHHTIVLENPVSEISDETHRPHTAATLLAIEHFSDLIADSHCIDLGAGSGILALALPNYEVRSIRLVEINEIVVAQLKSNIRASGQPITKFEILAEDFSNIKTQQSLLHYPDSHPLTLLANIGPHEAYGGQNGALAHAINIAKDSRVGTVVFGGFDEQLYKVANTRYRLECAGYRQIGSVKIPYNHELTADNKQNAAIAIVMKRDKTK